MSYIWHGIQTQSIERLSVTADEQVEVRSTVDANGDS
jgi:hypothetical protein